MEPVELIRRRIGGQHLTGEPCAGPGEVVSRLGAMQAQEFAEAKWSIGERVREGCTDADVEAAFERGEILRTHLLRPTWHFVAPADIRWMLELTAPRVQALNRGVYRQLGLDERTLGRAEEVIEQALRGGNALTRAELRELFAEEGVGGDGLRAAYVLMNAELEGLVCSGPRRGKQQTYMLVAERAPAAIALDREQALAELTRRYFATRGPARPQDFAYWSGLTVADARAGLALTGDEFEERTDEQRRSWHATPERWEADSAAGAGAFLIPTYDELVISYRELKVTFAEAPSRDGLLQRAIVIDGRTVGSWRRTLGRHSVTVEATLFGRLDRSQVRRLEAVAERFGRFLGLEAKLEMVDTG